MTVQEFFDPSTSTLTYVVFNRERDAIIIDPVLDYDPAASSVSFESFRKLRRFIDEKELRPQAVIETHAHADHLTSCRYLKRKYPQARLTIGEKVCEVQKTFKAIYNFGDEFKTDGSQYDHLVKDGEEFSVGGLCIKALHTPGHTPACTSYVIEDAVFTGDALFMPDSGTGRCDFPQGSAEQLYHSIHDKLYALPDETRIFTGHDYQPGGRELRFTCTVAESKERNIQLKAATTSAEFIAFRKERDKKLKAPRLLLPSIQININGGMLPQPEAGGGRYLKLPLTLADEPV